MKWFLVFLFNLFAISLASSVRSRSTCKAHSHHSHKAETAEPSSESTPASTSTPEATNLPKSQETNIPQQTSLHQQTNKQKSQVSSPLSSNACVVSEWSKFAGCLSSKEILISNLKVPSRTTLDFTNILPGTHVRFEGTIKFACSGQWEGPLVRFTGKNLRVDGNGVLDGNGPCYWDGLGSNAGSSLKPFFFQTFMVYDSVFTGFTLKNTPRQAVQIEAFNVIYSGITIDDSEGNKSRGGHNTDGFIIGASSNITIENCTVDNQDDCVAIDSGTDIHITGMSCKGGNGLAICVGEKKSNSASNILVEKSTLIDTQVGVQIRTVQHSTGSVSNVTFTDIALENIQHYGVNIDQSFINPTPSGKPTNGVKISDVVFHNITGSIGRFGFPIYLLCGDGSCHHVQLDDVNLTGGKGENKCLNIHPPGISC